MHMLNNYINHLPEDNKYAVIDVEAHERCQRHILEVGVAIVDYAKGSIQPHHFVIEEHYKTRNKKFVPDNKDNYDYGDSVMISQEHIAVQIHHLLQDVDCVVGHAVKSDIKWLRRLGIQVDKSMDTQKLYKCAMWEPQAASVKTMIETLLREEPKHLHNAGNDAYYTARCFMHLRSLICSRGKAIMNPYLHEGQAIGVGA